MWKAVCDTINNPILSAYGSWTKNPYFENISNELFLLFIEYDNIKFEEKIKGIHLSERYQVAHYYALLSDGFKSMASMW